MFTDFILDFKNWWIGELPKVGNEEFERIESKHTRVHHDEDIYEVIRVH
ncbi:hypothetical protein M3204_22740 [Mesobacillus subterraneus]|jgi:hypothetical protein|nr:hypothetical protein [Mesobacillus subterraneus]MCM3667219.1 hypothetical protein [Mesobacillus subterraneus]MCM3686153.1 hypothetical protein [Mesobacillus subterraneus]